MELNAEHCTYAQLYTFKTIENKKLLRKNVIKKILTSGRYTTNKQFKYWMY